ncbi:MAG TPA: sigma-70 family RNA polymerase sigma factor, partial [Solirubrobacter sp.]|nr:sigma-70 family RNA polymerase sigma factor [Solirubrobacter sp.]
MTATEEEFRRLVDEHRGILHAHCYRMLGSPHDADDALQETLVRAWRALPGFRADAPARPWLFKIATNVCLDELARRPRRELVLGDRAPAAPGEMPGAPLTEVAWLEPYPDEPGATYEQRERVELAFT